MSNIYIQEPPTSGKILLKTSVGDIDIELWSKECPKTCRNFVQLCMEGYYDGLLFHRVVKGFIAQGGDPNGDGTGGESIYGEPFKDEFHSRLRFCRRGMLGMANCGADDNGSQFFFTMGPTPELQNMNTLFGKVTGDTVFNMLKLEEALVDHNERPLYPLKIIGAEILNNPFNDIVPRILKKVEKVKKKPKDRAKAIKNFGLLSFGEEAEEDEEEINKYCQKNVGKAKSMHDVLDDPTLSKNVIKIENLEDDNKLEEDHQKQIKEEDDDAENRMNRIKDKLKGNQILNSKPFNKLKKPVIEVKEEDTDSDEDELLTQEKQQKMENEKKKSDIRKEITQLKKDFQADRKIKEEEVIEKNDKQNDLKSKAESNAFIKNFLDQKEKYTKVKSSVPSKGKSREDFTLNLLAKFRNKLDTLKQQKTDSDDNKSIEDDIECDNWLTHTLKFENNTPTVAKDASTKNDDWYDVYDPRNPLNKRKRGETTSKNKRSK